MNINLHIGRLIVDGLPVARHQRASLQAAIEAELADLLVAGDLAPGLQEGGAVPLARGGSIRLSGEDGPAEMGRQIAQAVYGGIGR